VPASAAGAERGAPLRVPQESEPGLAHKRSPAGGIETKLTKLQNQTENINKKPKKNKNLVIYFIFLVKIILFISNEL
jgi:hypothetical protein